MKTLPKELVNKTKDWLKDPGIKHFKNIKEKHGKIDAVFMDGPIPHPVHFQEGMTVRNFMRHQIECKGWGDHDFDDNWVSLIEECIK